MTKEIKNLPASVWARLVAMAKENRAEPMSLLRRYLQERFLFRLSRSQHRGRLILKGAMMLVAHDIPFPRPTRDVDFLARDITNTIEVLQPLLAEIAEISINDGVTFSVSRMELENIAEGDHYRGIRAHIPANLGKIKDRLPIDIGFGDIIIPSAIELEYPVLLDSEHPRILTYSLESSLSEKFEAMVSLGEINSRMKDFYDVRFLASQKEFEAMTLRKAILETFKRRGTEIAIRGFLWEKKFSTEKNGAWRAYLNANALELDMEFDQVMGSLRDFIEPVVSSDLKLRWNRDSWMWE